MPLINLIIVPIARPIHQDVKTPVSECHDVTISIGEAIINACQDILTTLLSRLGPLTVKKATITAYMSGNNSVP
ncbi:Uncharacterised protein [Chlamydia trachomatis]|nr:Uncharacterised protein [Chlamydia trachomatis]